MARSRDWDALSDNYRGRLERGGIGREAYLGGASLSAARGHRATPEHPRQAERNPAEFRDYIFKRDRLVGDILRAKFALFGSRDKYNAVRSRRNISVDNKGKPRSIASLNRIKDALQAADSWDDIVDSELSEDEISALYYH